MKTIIVAVDFSRGSDNSVRYAAALARAAGSRIILFNSFTIPIHVANSLLSSKSIDNLEKENQKILKEKCEWLSQEYSIEVSYEAALLLDVTDQLEILYNKYEADFVVMGMGSDSVAQDLFGNNTTSAIMKLSFPVLAIPEGAEFEGIENILFAYDGLELGKNKIPKKIREWSHDLNARLEVFHVQELNKEVAVENVLAENFEDNGYEYKEVESSDIISEIEKEMKLIKADLLIMVPRKYGFWESLVHRSRTRLMASASDVPVLSFPVIE